MSTIQAQTWKGSSFTIKRTKDNASGTVVFCLSGPFTARDMYGSLTPDALSNMFDFQSPDDHGQPPPLNILDLTHVPYLDSAGLGIIVRHYVRCKSKGIALIVAGAGERVLELFKMTKVDGLIPMVATVEEAEAH
jgi:ABC-type transporter Mla MlaB component